MNPDQKIQELEQKVEDLMKWKADRERQQVTYPLDMNSITVLNKYFLRILNTITYEIVGAASHNVTEYQGQQGVDGVTNAPENLLVTFTPTSTFEYTANASDDYVTVSGGNFSDGQSVFLNATATGSFPTPLLINTTYYVTNPVSRQKFKLSTDGVTPINITDSGSGPQYITYGFD